MWGLSMLAAGVVVAALVVTRVADEMRGPVETAVQEALGLPVTLGQVGLGWLGWQPVVSLEALQINPDAPDGAWLVADTLHVHLRWADLIRRHWTPYRVTAVGAELRDSAALRDWVSSRSVPKGNGQRQGLQLAFRDLRIDGGNRLPGALELPSGWLDWYPADGRIEGQTKALLNWGSFDQAQREAAAALDISGYWREGRVVVNIEGLDTAVSGAPGLVLTAAPSGDAWQGELTPTNGGGKAPPWLRWVADDQGVQAEGDAVPIQAFFSLLQRYVPAVREEWSMSGQLFEMRGDWRWTSRNGAPRFSLQARLDDVAVSTADAELAAVHGYIALDEQGGYFQPAAQAPSFRMRGWRQVLLLDHWQGNWVWARQSQGEWRLAAPELALAALGTSVQGRVLLIAGGELPSPQLDLDLRLDAESVAAAHPYWPTVWPESLRDWLRLAILEGSVTAGQLRIDGDLADFPYGDRPTGQWQLDLPVRGGSLKFAPEWPALTAMEARVRFAGNRLTAEVPSAQFGNVSGVSGAARIEALTSAAVLEVDARGRDQIPALLALIDETPLQSRFTELVETVEANGAAAVNVALKIPLNKLEDTRASGTVTLDDVTLQVVGLDEPVVAVRGAVDFNGDKLDGDDLSGRWHGAPVMAAISGDEGGVVLDLRGEALPVGALRPWLPLPVFERLAGALKWSGQLALPQQGQRLFSASSSLVGVAVNLPSPIDKAVDDPRRFELKAPLPPSAEAPVTFAWGGQFLTGEIADGRVELRLGDPPAVLVDALGDSDGLWVAADLSSVDGVEWLRWLTRFGEVPPELRLPEVVDDEEVALRLAGAEVRLMRLKAGAWSLGRQTASVRRVSGGWRTALDGAASGTLQTTDSGGFLQLASLALAVDLPKEPDWSNVTAPPDAPPLAEETSFAEGNWTGQVDRLSVNDLTLGSVVLTAALQSDNRMSLNLAVADGALKGTASYVADGMLRSSRGQLATDVPHTMMAALGFESPLEADEAGTSWELAWPATGTRLAVPTAEGNVGVWAREGQLRAVDPGAGRLLGLFNFYQLPRRLLFDFRDVTDDGLYFDTFDAKLRLDHGRVVTDDMTLRGPSVRMAIEGETHLLTRELDQRVTVYPDLTSGASIGAALLGGPAVGVLMLLAQTLLEKPLDAVGQFSYRIRGTWDDPQIDKLPPTGVAAGTPSSPSQEP